MAHDRTAPRNPAPADERDSSGRRPGSIRSDDVEPRMALENVSRVFRIAATVVDVAAVMEVIMGLALEGPGLILVLVASSIQSLVLAAILWAAGDITSLLIDVAHDMRAGRILLARISARGVDPQPPSDRTPR